MVRAGDMPLEIALLRTGSDGQLHGIGTEVTFAPDGTPVGPLSPAEVGARAIGSTIRISNQRLIGALLDQPPLPAWERHPWLARLGALILDEDGATTVEASDGTAILINYDSEVGLTSSG